MKRIRYLDIASGIMILWVLYFHALYPMYGNSELDKIPFLFFFMPWFFYKSGFLFKCRDTKALFRKDARKLLPTYALWSVIGYICYILHRKAMGQVLDFHTVVQSPLRTLLLCGTVPLNNALWFLIVLFIVRQIANWGLKKWHPCIIMAVSGALTVLFSYLHLRFFPSWINNTAWGVFFFAAGYFLNNKETNIWLVIGSFIIVICAILFTDIPAKYSRAVPRWEDLVWYPICVFGCISFDNLCRWIDSAFSFLTERVHKKQCTRIGILEYVGQHAMTFYVVHCIVFRIVFDWVDRFNEEWYQGWQGVMIITAAYALTILPICAFQDRRRRGGTR